MAINNYSFPSDAFPVEIVDAYQQLQENLELWLSPYYGTDRLISYFDFSLKQCESPEKSINYICDLQRIGGREPGLLLASGTLAEVSFKESYLVWVVVRLTETLCSYIGNSRLRSGRSILEENWIAVGQRDMLQNEDDSLATLLLQFLFKVLIPFARGSVLVQRPISVQERTVEEAVPDAPRHDNSAGSQITRTHTALVHTIETLCRAPFTPVDLRELLTYLMVLDSETGHWHLGKLRGKAAAPLSAFPAAYRAAQEANLMLLTDAPVYRKLFVEEFKVDFKDRLANFKDGSPSASTAFHEYLNKARIWIKVWKSKQQVFMRAV